MKSLMLASLLLLPLAASATDATRCEHSKDLNLQLDLAGVKTVVFDVGASDLDLRASSEKLGTVNGRACASDPKLLTRITLTQDKQGDRLTVRARRNGEDDVGLRFNLDLFGVTHRRYADLTLRATVPDDLAVDLKTGSGDAKVAGVHSLDATVGSGDVSVSGIRGSFSGSTGSGDMQGTDVGALDLRSIGSGDVSIRQVRGPARIGSFGSGDIEIRQTSGAVDIGSGGSGDITLTDIGGSIAIGSIGSGDVEVDGARGDLIVRAKGSGDIEHRGVSGRIELPRGN
ncbi:DUF4097 family beta strand repeat-containing protein [Novilysobacter antarcticus]|uniref:DUF4097 family beta strand repeat-containing protein n=1 Tax=Novilysobacter antarcticus TaxID=2862543 RepID=UPI001C9A17D0|nr:DUF4097 family beta strand repeat-containing protein [Lysobacter antarcticus]